VGLIGLACSMTNAKKIEKKLMPSS